MSASQPTDTSSAAGRTALVTGAASGIGAAVVRRFARDGMTVVAVDRDAGGLTALRTDLAGESQALADLVEPVAVDLTDLAAVDALAASQPADVLVNNAGIQHVAPIQEFPPDTFDLIIALMLTSPFRLIRGALPHMYARGWGRVINISSVHGVRASEFKSAYVAAKHGMEGLSKVTALEGGPHGVTSNCVNPAYVRTPLVEKQIAAQATRHGIAESEVIEQIMLAPVAVKRLVEPDEVAELVAFLASDHAASVTGSSYLMDGGWSAH
ncbi:3-hydroxybutyrate dehydrogenase [Nakamurella aerolata]|uniref:3-hydroxybutyrate dehydrogenase n=1 Tax=Nakamurella aerolata TaxID=1656892 RepID=A0A849A4T0_9ACTN|nr:3-hydroxybutyrate dehydrogenase [Nakamurella aerolata]NNG35579.1 3-hydroxybutyrate dehydrogenase [Nakamurella aerolata]